MGALKPWDGLSVLEVGVLSLEYDVPHIVLAVQGLGGGAILSSTSIIVSDLVSLRERGAYNGLIGL